MIDRQLSPIEPSRIHAVGTQVSWHGRLMASGWGVLIPLGNFAARYTKVMPWQKWPEEVDSRFWLNGHGGAQNCGVGLALAGLWRILAVCRSPLAASTAVLHHLLGWAIMALGLMQMVVGWLPGSKGGPTERRLWYDRYDMRSRRLRV